jgi:hypothetical protein
MKPPSPGETRVMKNTRQNAPALRLRRPAPLAAVLLTAALALLLGACTAARVTVPGASYASPQAALQAIAAGKPAPAVTATARIEIASPSERYPFKAALMMKPPESLRLESIPLLGPPDFFLSLNGKELRAFLPGKGLFYIEQATAWALSRFIHIALPPTEIVSLLTGRAPPEKAEGDSLVFWRGEREEGLYRVDLYRAAGRIRSLWIDPDKDRLLRIQVYEGGDTPPYTAEFAEHTRVGEFFIPQRLKITAEGLAFSLLYTELRPLTDEDSAAFVLPVPEGVTPTPLQ